MTVSLRKTASPPGDCALGQHERELAGRIQQQLPADRPAFDDPVDVTGGFAGHRRSENDTSVIGGLQKPGRDARQEMTHDPGVPFHGSQVVLLLPKTEPGGGPARRVPDGGQSRQGEHRLRLGPADLERPEDALHINHGRKGLPRFGPADLRLAHGTSEGQPLPGEPGRCAQFAEY